MHDQHMQDNIRKLIEFIETSKPLVAAEFNSHEFTTFIRRDILPLCTEVRRLDANVERLEADVERLKSQLKSERSFSVADCIDL